MSRLDFLSGGGDGIGEVGLELGLAGRLEDRGQR